MSTKQPTGMYVLAFTETFERFSFYTLVFQLVLYANATLSQGGLGWTMQEALALVSIYSMAAYTLPLIGSIIADHVLGRYHAVLIGGVIIFLGHVCIMFSGHSETILYIALAMVACGTALLKPSMPALLGRLYEHNDPRRSAAFSLYYAGINLGGFAAGIISGLLAQHYGYHVALGSAAVGMLIGLCVFYSGRHHLVLDKPGAQAPEASSPARTGGLSAVERKAIQALFIGLAFFGLWGVCYNLALSGTLSLYIEHYTQRTIGSFEIPTTFFQSLNSLVIILAAPVISFMLARMALKKHYPHAFSQMAFGMLVLAISMIYLVYLVHVAQSTQGLNVKPFHWTEIALFMIIYSLSEIIISPAMMAAISVLAPFRHKTTFQGLNLLLIGITALIAGKLGSLSFREPMAVFSGLSIIVFVAAVLYFMIKGYLIRIANAEEQEKSGTVGQQKTPTAQA